MVNTTLITVISGQMRQWPFLGIMVVELTQKKDASLIKLEIDFIFFYKRYQSREGTIKNYDYRLRSMISYYIVLGELSPPSLQEIALLCAYFSIFEIYSDTS